MPHRRTGTRLSHPRATHLALPAILRSRDTLGILLTQSLLLWMSLAPPPITLALINGELSDPFNNIVVNKSDKGSEVVVSDMDHYIVEGVVHLSDVETYVPVGEDPTLAIAAEVTAFAKELLAAGYVDEIESSLYSHPTLFGLLSSTTCGKHTKHLCLFVLLCRAARDLWQIYRPSWISFKKVK